MVAEQQLQVAENADYSALAADPKIYIKKDISVKEKKTDKKLWLQLELYTIEFSVKSHIWRGLYKLTYIALWLIEN